MWEPEKKHIGVKILLIILILVLLAGLFYAYRIVKAQEEAHDAELLQVYEQHQKEQNAARQANYDTLETLYQTDLDTVSRYLPGIVCWGDVTTAGSAGGVSYPDTLQELIDAAICDKYDFFSTLEDKTSYGRISDWTVYSVEIPVVNMGSGQENSATVAGRNGAIPFVTAEAFTIPSQVYSVEIKIQSSDGSTVMPLTQGDAGVNPVVINGVQGKLSLDLETYYNRHRYSYTFTRLAPGEPVNVPAGAVITTAASSLYTNYLPIIFIGTYDDKMSTADELIHYQKSIINHQIANKDRYLILGLYSMDNRWDLGRTSDLDLFETSMLQEYGDHYISVRKYLCSDGLADAEITPTKQDTDDIKLGYVPSSLRSTSSTSELNAKGYQLLGKIVFDRMDKLGYFKEVKDELGITALEKLERQEAAKATPRP